MPGTANEAGGYALEDLSIGMTERFSKTVTEADIVLFAGISGDTNPVHLDADFAATTPFRERIAHGMLTATFISAVLGARMPGPGSIYMRQLLEFRAPVKIGDTAVATVEVTAIDEKKARVTLKTTVRVGETEVVRGEALIMVPRRPAG